MSPAFLLTLLVATLIALIPVWRLRAAGWPPRSLLVAWVMYAVGIFVAVRFPATARFLVPVLVVAFLAPFVAGPERLTRLLNGRRTAPGVIIDVTPRPLSELPRPPHASEPAEPAEPAPARPEAGPKNDGGAGA